MEIGDGGSHCGSGGGGNDRKDNEDIGYVKRSGATARSMDINSLQRGLPRGDAGRSKPLAPDQHAAKRAEILKVKQAMSPR